MVDPVSAAGVAIGTVSLVIQLLDGCATGYRYFLEADNMEKDCEFLKVRLEMECRRLQVWRQSSGLADMEDGQDIPKSLRADKLLLIAILTQIHALMSDFAEINGRYYDLQPREAPTNQEPIQEKSVSELAEVSFPKHLETRDTKSHRSLNKIKRSLTMVKNVAKHPQKLRWVAFDKEVFLELLGKLSEFNTYLEELLHGHEQQALLAASEWTIRELVQVRTSVEDLKHLVAASILFSDRTSAQAMNGSAKVRLRQRKALVSLAKFKEVRAINDVPDEQRPHEYNSLMQSIEITNVLKDNDVSQPIGTTIRYSSDELKSEDEAVSGASDRLRSEGVLFQENQETLQVWIEWKSYTPEPSRQNIRMPSAIHVKRVKELVALLRADKPDELRTPRCLGFFDDCAGPVKKIKPCRFGLVYEKPKKDNDYIGPVSLHHLIRTISMPPLSERVELAHTLATSVLYFHAVNWLHKALRSDSILLFPRDGVPIIQHPSITGYEYARPDMNEESTTRADHNPWSELYAHPSYQGDKKSGYRKTFDIYSLGIVLLEIAHWKSIEQIMGIDPDKALSHQLSNIRDSLVAPGSPYIEYVRGNLGDKYSKAVKSCIEGRDAFGIKKGEREADVTTGLNLQEGFTTLVVDPLGKIEV